MKINLFIFLNIFLEKLELFINDIEAMPLQLEKVLEMHFELSKQ